MKMNLTRANIQGHGDIKNEIVEILSEDDLNKEKLVKCAYGIFWVFSKFLEPIKKEIVMKDKLTIK